MAWGKKSSKTIKTAKLLKKELEQENNSTKAWIEQYVPNIHAKRLLKIHTKRSSAMSRDFSELMVRALSTVDAAYRANAAFIKDFFPNNPDEAVQINVREVMSIQAKMLQLQVMRLVMDYSDFTPRQRKVMIRRYIAQLWPTNDDVTRISQSVENKDKKGAGNVTLRDKRQPERPHNNPAKTASFSDIAKNLKF